jgi:hypothetical protein
MARKRKLEFRCEDPNEGYPVGLHFDERALREPEVGGDPLHPLRVEPSQIGHHAEIVAALFPAGEHSDNGAISHESSVDRSLVEGSG